MCVALMEGTSEGVLYQALYSPCTAAAIGVCMAFWLIISGKRWGYQEVGMSYDSLVRKREYYRMFSSSFAHVNILHLAFNMRYCFSHSLPDISLIEFVLNLARFGRADQLRTYSVGSTI